jgi:hypothetical protein
VWTGTVHAGDHRQGRAHCRHGVAESARHVLVASGVSVPAG